MKFNVHLLVLVLDCEPSPASSLRILWGFVLHKTALRVKKVMLIWVHLAFKYEDGDSCRSISM